MDTGELPEHLKGLKNHNDACWISKPDDSEYAEIAFTLLKCLDGNKEAITKVSQYLQKQHSIAKSNYETCTKLKTDINVWLSWATHWTIHKNVDRGII